jgi:uncharacterized membrane protein YfcA
MLDALQYALGAASGALVGFTLGLIGGGGSILAVPLMVYVVGVHNPHVAIGTSAFAVAVNALVNLLGHHRAGTVNWRCGGFYALAGALGSLAGSTAGKSIDGHKLLFLFALLMLAVAVLMIKRRGEVGVIGAQCNKENLPRVLQFGAASGAVSGFFGIGGGFLIVPGLIASTRMPMVNAIGTSLVAVAAFALTAAANYARSGLVDWVLAICFIFGGYFGGVMGIRIGRRLSVSNSQMNLIFAAIIILVAIYMLAQTLS